ncbi:MAG: dicarboxylate/amino acid:cation symporter [Bryobacterales bacterium]|nr:dicarboxylate/amino acid:cation symporter [Bryobacterales bacterium]
MLLLGAMAAGLAAGWFFPDPSRQFELLGALFLRLIRTIIAPLMFGVLVPAVARAGAMRTLGRMGLRAVILFEVLTTIALLWGLGWTLLLEPGTGLQLPPAQMPDGHLSIASILEQAFPTSIFDAMARGDVLQMVVFFTGIGLACSTLGPKAEPLVEFAESIGAITFRMTAILMYAAPLAVFGAMASTIASQGPGALASLARWIGTAWVAQVSYTVVILGGMLRITGMPISRFAREVREPFVVAFTTTSSAAALPSALAGVARLGVSPPVAGFVTPLSLSFNLEGSTIHLMMAAVFVAQAAGMRLEWEQLLLMMLTLKLTSKGVAGIPRANFVILTALFSGLGLPAEGLALLLGVDALIDPVRTALNILGHCAAPVAVERWPTK